MIMSISIFLFIQVVRFFPVEFGYYPDNTRNKIEDCPHGFKCYAPVFTYD